MEIDLVGPGRAWGGHAGKRGEGYGVGDGRESFGVDREYMREGGGEMYIGR